MKKYMKISVLRVNNVSYCSIMDSTKKSLIIWNLLREIKNNIVLFFIIASLSDIRMVYPLSRNEYFL